MKLFLDIADTAVVAQNFTAGVVDGVTTNPTLIKKSGRDPHDVYKDLIKIGLSDISMEVVGTVAEMIEEGYNLVNHFGYENCTIKLPLTRDGLIACKQLSGANIRTNLTLVFSVEQAVLAAKAGATYVSPFVGRLDDIGVDGIGLISDIKSAFVLGGFETEILSASIRTVDKVMASFVAGADIVTMPPSILDEMYQHDLTNKGLEIFDADWAAVSHSEFEKEDCEECDS